jgi:bacteriorhodopsin
MIFSFLFTIFAFIQGNNKLILFLEILITGVSSYMYYLFTTIKDLHSISLLRYTGWLITTPIMLVALCLLSNIYSIPILITIIVLDLIMLLFGYLGETKRISRITASLGFVPLLSIFYLLYINSEVNLIFVIYLLIWSGYGIVYYFDEKIKNICMSLFDAIAKGLVAILISIHLNNFAFQINVNAIPKFRSII